MVFNAYFNSVPVHLPIHSWSSSNHYSVQYSFQATGCFPTEPSSKQQNIGRAGDRTSNPLFSGPVLFRLNYAGLVFRIRIQSNKFKDVVRKGKMTSPPPPPSPAPPHPLIFLFIRPACSDIHVSQRISGRTYIHNFI